MAYFVAYDDVVEQEVRLADEEARVAYGGRESRIEAWA